MSKVYWLTGLSGAGKSTIAKGAEVALTRQVERIKVLDGDEIRLGINADLGFSEEDRLENNRRTAEIAKLFMTSGFTVIVSFISPLKTFRTMAKSIIGASQLYEVYINADLHTCETRDTKGLYKKARNGFIKEFTGISAPYEVPIQPNLEINTAQQNVDESINTLVQFILNNNEI